MMRISEHVPEFAAVVTAVLLGGSAMAASVTWDAGGVADTNWSTGANWLGSPDNTAPATGDNVVFGTGGSAVTLNVAPTVGLISFNRGVAFDLGNANSGGNALTITSGITVAGSNVAYTLSAPVILGAANLWTFTQGDRNLTLSNSVTGAFPVSITLNNYRDTLTLSGNNAGASGGFAIANTGTASGASSPADVCKLYADGTNSLGTGQSTLGSSVLLRYSTGALASGAPPLIVQGQLNFNNTPGGATDKFAIAAGGIVNGTAAQLGALTVGTNITIAPDAMVAHSALNQTTINALPTDASLVFGLSATVNTPANSLTIGTGTPWKGFGTAMNGTPVLQSGTVNIATTGGLPQIVLQGIVMKTVPSGGLTIGSGATAPTLQLAAGSTTTVPALVRYNLVEIATSAANWAPAISKWTVAPGAMLSTTQPTGLQSKSADLDSAALRANGAAGATVGAVTYAESSRIVLANAASTLGAPSLTRIGRATLGVNAGTGVIGNLGTTGEKLTVAAGFAAGAVAPYIFGFAGTGDLQGQVALRFLDYDVANGFKAFTPDSTDLNTATQGQRVLYNVATNPTMSGNRTVLGLIMQGSGGGSTLNGTGTLRLGVNSDGSDAAYAGICLSENDHSLNVVPAVDFGTAEGIVLYSSNRTDSGRAWTFTGAVKGSGGMTVSMNPSAVMRLVNAANTLTGPITINSGTFQINGGNGLTASSPLFVGARAIFELTTTAPATETVGGLSGRGGVMIATGKVLEVANPAIDYTFDGVLSGLGGLTKSGAGALTLTGISTYTGATTVNGGTLLVNGSLASPVTLGAGTLSGTGRVTGTVNLTGGTLAPGASPGVLELAGDLSLGPLATYAVELGGGMPGDGSGHYDQTLVSGTATLDGALSVALLGGYVPGSSDAFYILSRAGGGGTFSGLPEGASLSLGLYSAQITYLANWTGTQAGSTVSGGNDVALYSFVVPEPAALVLGLLAGGCCLHRRRGGAA